MVQDSSDTRGLLARLTELLDVVDRTTTEFELIEIPFRHILLEASEYGANWTFRVGDSQETSPVLETRHDLQAALARQRTEPVNLGLYASRTNVGAVK